MDEINFVEKIKSLEIKYSQEQAPDGEIYSWPEFYPSIWGSGLSSEESIQDMLEALSECARIIYDDDIKKIEREKLPYILKILLCTPKELRLCLRGRN